MSQENIDVIKRAAAALNSHHVDTIDTLYAPRVEFRDLSHAPDAPEVVHGIEAVKQIWGDWLTVVEGLRCDVKEYVVVGDWVVAVSHWSGRGKGSGVVVDVHTADAYEVKDGKIVRVVLGYESKADALEAVGLSE